MNEILIFVMFFIGLIIIIKGGDLFVEAAVWIAIITGIPTILIGATLVSFATTLPEFFVSTIAATKGYTEMAIGNAIGSTICNMGFILGICSLISPVTIRRRFFTIKGLLMIGALISFYYFSRDYVVDEFDGYVLLLILILYIIINITEFKTNVEAKDSVEKWNGLSFAKNICKFIFGCGLIILGARLLVDNGVEIANIFNVPEQVISLTLIALGTSLPELITSITAIIKGHMGISVGNIIGANILNITMVLGGSSLLSQNGLLISTRDFSIADRMLVQVPQTLVFDIPVSLLMMVIIVLCGTYKRMIDRFHGALLLSLYLGYLSILVYISF